VNLPGYREGSRFGTYSSFALSSLPPIGRRLDPNLEWLRGEASVTGSLADRDPGDPEPRRVASAYELESMVEGTGVMVPPAFEMFIGSRELQSRIASVTACYLDLADEVVALPDGGHAIHFLSDQQWILHWLLFVGRDGSQAVIATEEGLGFRYRDPEDLPTTLRPETAAVCADSFSEFLYRFWLENELWRALSPGANGTLTDEQRRYLDHYRPS